MSKKLKMMVFGVLSIWLFTTSCSNLFGPYNNDADHFSAEVLWTRTAENIDDYGFEVIDDGFSPTNGSLVHIAANPEAESTEESDSLFLAYSSGDSPDTVTAHFETLTDVYSGPDIFVRDLIVDGLGNAYLVGFDPDDDLQKIFAIDFSNGAYSLLATVPINMPWRVINPNAGAAISNNGLSIYVSIPTKFVILEYTMSSPGDPGGSWEVIAGESGAQGDPGQGDNNPASEALLAGPFAVTEDGKGGLLFLDSIISFIDGEANYVRPDIPRLRRIDSNGILSTFSDIPVLDMVSLPFMEVFYSAYDYAISDGYLSVDKDQNILFGNIDEVIRIEERNGKATVITGEVERQFDFETPLSDWSADTGMLAERAFDVDMRFIMDIMPAPDGSILVSQGGFGNVQGIRILRLFQD